MTFGIYLTKEVNNINTPTSLVLCLEDKYSDRLEPIKEATINIFIRHCSHVHGQGI